jgi:integral membrane protein
VAKGRRISDDVGMKGLLATSVGRLRAIAFIEGMSYMVLVFVAMPLKYLGDMPTPVRVVGMAHGVLFVAFSLALLKVFLEQRLGQPQERTLLTDHTNLWRSALTFASSLLPFGTFVVDGYLKRWSGAAE